MKAVLRKVRISSKKANLIAGIVRGKKVNDALAVLKYMPKKGAKIMYKVIHSAAYNAKNNFKQDLGDLYIVSIVVNKGPTLKRSIPASRGRSHPILKKSCNITVEVGVKADEGKPVLKPITEKKAEPKVEPKASASAKATAGKKEKATTKKAEPKEKKVKADVKEEKPKAKKKTTK
jgi:large subunit ribosomal protein L22